MHFIPTYLDGAKYSGMDKVSFVEDSLLKTILDPFLNTLPHLYIYINKYNMDIYIISIHVLISLIFYEFSITCRFNETYTYSITNTY